MVESTYAVLTLVGMYVSTSWEKLSNMKESHPLQMAEYAIAMGVDHESSFNWWVLHMLKKHDSIIALEKKCSARYLKGMH